MSFLKKNCCDGIYNSSIDIRFTKSCDNRCSFCIEDMTGVDSFGKTSVDRIIDSVRSGVVNEGKDTVLILGGEPFLFPRELKQFVEGIRPFVKNIYITTSMPKELDFNGKFYPELRFIMDNIDGLNVSVHHWDWKKNNEILSATRDNNRLLQLKYLAYWYNYGHKIRIQCNLVKDQFDTIHDLVAMTSLAMQYNIAELKFNELQDVGADLYASFDSILPHIKLPPPYSGGCVSDVSKEFKAGNVKVTVKRCCFMVQEHTPNQATWRDLLKVVLKKFKSRKSTGANVIYENGLRAKGWLQKEIPTTKIS